MPWAVTVGYTAWTVVKVASMKIIQRKDTNKRTPSNNTGIYRYIILIRSALDQSITIEKYRFNNQGNALFVKNFLRA
jgi:membrane carboxypeptidase/penicillin-binding protein